MGEMVMQVLVGSVSVINIPLNLGKRLILIGVILVISTQIIQTEGSYSFPLCGMIIACLGFILFIGLLLSHRTHRNYLAGIVRPMFSFSVFNFAPSPPR